jgi:type IV pilus assembly protein PilP
MMKLPIKHLGLHVFVGLVITGCVFQDDHQDLKDYIAEVRARPQGSIEPLPPVRTYDAFIYGATALRSPFDQPVEVKAVVGVRSPDIKPDNTREKEFLESFNLDELAMVGMMEQKGSLWALMKDGVGGIHRVSLGNYMGKNHGKIISVTADQLDLLEIVSDGLGGWVQRPRTIKLSEKE